MLPLKKLVERYRALAGDYGKPVALTAFDLTRDGDGAVVFQLRRGLPHQPVFSFQRRRMA